MISETNRCKRCKRPSSLCLCFKLETVQNTIHICVLQHPKERYHPFNTGRLIVDTLENSSLWFGEDFSQHMLLIHFLKNKNAALLYPEQSREDSISITNKLDVIIVIDASWKKSYKIVKLSKILETLPRISISPAYLSKYKIRKAAKPGQLSSIEAVYEALKKCNQNHTSLIKNFKIMVDQQLTLEEKFKPNK